jgi:hypothetical protein
VSNGFEKASISVVVDLEFSLRSVELTQMGASVVRAFLH